MSVSERQETLNLSYQHVIPGRLTSLSDLGISIMMGKREGYQFRDLDGREFMDFHLNGSTYNLGHRNPGLSGCCASPSIIWTWAIITFRRWRARCWLRSCRACRRAEIQIRRVHRGCR